FKMRWSLLLTSSTPAMSSWSIRFCYWDDIQGGCALLDSRVCQLYTNADVASLDELTRSYFDQSCKVCAEHAGQAACDVDDRCAWRGPWGSCAFSRTSTLVRRALRDPSYRNTFFHIMSQDYHGTCKLIYEEDACNDHPTCRWALNACGVNSAAILAKSVPALAEIGQEGLLCQEATTSDTCEITRRKPALDFEDHRSDAVRKPGGWTVVFMLSFSTLM
ncbi:hypothetical protein FOZ63_001374, partial [Perkinsus olseni]